MTELQEAVAQAATIIIPDDMFLSSDAEGALIPFRYCSAPCGSGKTFQALKMAHELARWGKRVLLVQPTVELNEKIRIELEEKFSANVQCRVFNTETCGRGNVAAELSKYAKKLPRRSEIVLSTHQILPFMDGFEGKGNWHLVGAGAAGAGNDDDLYPRIMNGVLGTKMKIVTGYPGGGEVALAMERGEVQARCGWSWSSLKSGKPTWLSDHNVDVLVQLALNKHPDLPEVPLIMDLAQTDEQRRILTLIFARQ